MIQPQNLQPGDLIGIVCPAGAIPLERVQKSVEILTAWGYQVVLGKTVGTRFNHFSATDAERLADLQAMMDNPSVKAILCGRGGYGMSRIIEKVNFTSFSKHPKWVIGFSDITVLHAALQKNGYQSIHGPMSAAFNKGDAGAAYIESLKTILEGGKTNYKTTPHSLNQLGNATATLIGGNLCMMAHLIGSNYSFDTAGKILFIEDVGEYHYNLDRLVIQMKRAGMFDQLAGLIIGGFTDMKDASTDFGASAYEIIQAHSSGYAYPICFDFPISHATANFPVVEGGLYAFSINSEEVSLTMV